jgi:hypothetical protein
MIGNINNEKSPIIEKYSGDIETLKIKNKENKNNIPVKRRVMKYIIFK